MIDLYLSSFSLNCSSYLYLTMVFGDFRLMMSLSFTELNCDFIVVATMLFSFFKSLKQSY